MFIKHCLIATVASCDYCHICATYTVKTAQVDGKCNGELPVTILSEKERKSYLALTQSANSQRCLDFVFPLFNFEVRMMK